MIKIQLVICAIFVAICLSLMIYSYNRCGWGMFAYQNSFIAAVTGECAQQQNKAKQSDNQ